MAIFRGVGGSGDSSDNSFLQEVTAQANAASASAFSAATSAAAILNLTAATGDAGTDASYNPSTGVLTIPRGADGTDASVTAANVTGVLTGGTGISIASNGTITNDSPDQTVALTGTGATTITGTYPNFTINSVNTTYTVGDGGLTTNDFTDADHSKLNGIEANATADQTGAEIKSAYEAVADTNAFTDAEKTKLSGIEASATADQTDAEIKIAYENNANTNAFTDADHTKLDGLERTVRQRFQRRGYNNTISINALTTTYAQLGGNLRINSGATTAVENELDLNLTASHLDVNSSNEGLFVVTVDAPDPTTETTVNLGTVTGASFGAFSVSGDFTKHFSPYCGLSKNSDGSNAINFSNQQGWEYNPSTNLTTVYYYPYQTGFSTGDTVYLHPFDWETTGTEINGDEYPFEAYNAHGTATQNHFHQIYLGYYKPERTFKIKAKEISTGENIQITRVAGTYSQIIGS